MSDIPPAADGSGNDLLAKIHPIPRTRAHEEVARQLRELMQRGDLRPNDRLPAERELAKQFGVSRATIRHSLAVLEAAGLVESHAGSGTFTRERADGLNVTDLATVLRAAGSALTEQLELRRIVEAQVASLAAERATVDDIVRLEGHLAQQRSDPSGSAFISADSAFHLAIARATGNSLMVKMVEGIHELLHESRALSFRAIGTAVATEQHERILRTIKAHDGPAAYEAMMDHVLAVERGSLEAFAADTPSPLTHS